MSNTEQTPWVCIARTGTFQDSSGRPHTFTEADLEQIRAGYDQDKSEAPLVFGHPKDTDPAYGWVHALKREGARLFARFAHVPEKVRDLVQDKRYRYVSISLSPDRKRLLHVGLLGAAAPAIDGLGPVAFSTDGVTINFGAPEKLTLSVADSAAAPQATRADFGALPQNMNPPEGAKMEELQKQIGALTEKVNALQKENSDLKATLDSLAKGKDDAEKDKQAAEKQATAAAAEFAAFKGRLAADARAARVRALVDSGKLMPALEAETLSFAAALADVQKPVSFAAPNGTPEEISAEERWFRELEARSIDPRFVNFSAKLPAHSQELVTNVSTVDITAKL